MEEKLTRFDGKLHIFRRGNSPFWFCGFHFRGKYIRRSTKEPDRQRAIKHAEDWYTLKKAEILTTGEPSDGAGPTVAFIAKKTLKIMDAKVAAGTASAAYRKSVAIVLNSHIVPHFGKISVSKIDIVKWNNFVEEKMLGEKALSAGSIHQLKNALRLVLNTAYREGRIKNLPVLKDNSSGHKVKVPRIWFKPDEYRRLLRAIKAHAKTLKKTRWESDVEELYDYVVFNCNSGFRVGEARNIRFCDVEERNEMNNGERRKFLLISNIKGKRGTGVSRTMDGAVEAYQRILKRREIVDPKKSEEPLFVAYHRDMFRVILEKENLRFTNERPPRKRDLTVCRHTYISFRLLYGANAYDIANNCRTSTAMIDKHYAPFISPELTKGLNVRRFHRED